MTDVPPVRRRLLGAALRRFRESGGYTLDDAARILECDRSKISRIETGQRGWWQSYSHVLSDAYQDFISLEATAMNILTYEAQLIPGLLQTEDYARAIAAASL